jgi:hypothetical protein
MEATSTVTLIDLINVTQEIASLNLGYLTICVTIVLASGGFFYLFSFSPLQEKIKRQEDELGTLKKDTEAGVEKMKTDLVDLVSKQAAELGKTIAETTKELGLTISDTRDDLEKIKREALQKADDVEKQMQNFIKKAQSEFNELRNDHRISELNHLWLDHYMWEGRDVPANTITSLLEVREKQLAWNLPFVGDELWADRIKKTLEKIVRYAHNDKAKVLSRLQLLVDKLADEGKKIEIKKLIEKTFS